VSVPLEPTFDVAGLGIGPFGLSVAALLEPVPDLRARFFDRRPSFVWHAGLMFPEAEIQVSHLKDLVTLADPTSRFSFLYFLHRHKRLYRFTNADFPRVQRREFNQYLQWVVTQLPNLEFAAGVEAVEHHAGTLVLHIGERRVRARHLVLGTGLEPRVPGFARPHLGPTLFHACEYLSRAPRVAGRRVAVIGGGQTGAEIVSHLLDAHDRPAELTWLSRRSNFLPLDETAFTNELFTPSYSDHFFTLPLAARRSLLEEQKLAGAGIAPRQLERLCRRFYEIDFLDEQPKPAHHLLPGHVLEGLEASGAGWSLLVASPHAGVRFSFEADLVILATGFTHGLPRALQPILSRIDLEEGTFRLEEDFSIGWQGAPQNRIYVLNGARLARGVADPNLSLMAWRSAKIVNSLAGRQVYDVDGSQSLIDWPDLAALDPRRQQA
jgi:lysine N6-hydroxylase